MQRNIKDLTTELTKLSKKERLEIVKFLLSLDVRSLDSDDIDSAWENEITDRVRAVDERTAIGIDYDKAMQESGLARLLNEKYLSVFLSFFPTTHIFPVTFRTDTLTSHRTLFNTAFRQFTLYYFSATLTGKFIFEAGR